MEDPILVLDRVSPSEPPSLSQEIEERFENQNLGDPKSDPRPRPSRYLDGKLVRFDEQPDLTAACEAWRHSWDSQVEREVVDTQVR